MTTRRLIASLALSVLALALLALMLVLSSSSPAHAGVADANPGGVKISQVYGGGGGTGYYKYDYVELFNAGSAAADISGWTLQYGSATGNFASFSGNIYTFTTGTIIQPGQYLLVQLGAAGTGGLLLPVTPDITTTNLSMSGASGKVALANVSTVLGCGATATPCTLPDPRIVDLTAYGASNNAEGGASINNGVALTAQQGGIRKLNGCQDTDNNNNDFVVATGSALVPRNTSSPANLCGLSITKSAPVAVGLSSAYTYTVVVLNTTITATGVVITDALPTNVTLVPGSISDGGELLAGNIVSWTVADVPYIDTITRTFAVTSPATFASVVNQDYQVFAANLPTPISGTPVTTTVGGMDLAVAKAAVLGTVNPGDLVTYTLTYSNAGVAMATNVVVTDQLPSAMTYVTDSLGTGIVGSNGTVAWNVGDLNIGESNSIVLTATALYAGNWQNRATISGGPFDLNLNNNTSIVTTTINGSDPFVIKSGPSALFSGEVASTTITYGNHGNQAVPVTITDLLPIGFTTADIAADTSGLPFVDGANTRAWTTTVAADSSVSFTLALTVPTSIASNTRITNTIAITGAGLGNNPINDLASASSTVYQIVPIATARAGANGQVFAIEGSVIYAPGTLGTNEWGVQDSSGGISVFFSPAPVAALGDRVRLVATRGAFSGQAQLAAPVYFFANLGSGPQVTPKPYTTGQVAAGASEGWLIVITGTVSSLSACPTTANYQFNLDDGSGATTIFVDKDTAVNVCAQGVVNGDPLVITGFSTQFNGTFEVKPRFPADVIRYPRVLRVNPINNATGVTITAAITAAFNMTMTNVTSTTFTLQGPGGAVDGNVAYDVATKIATFTPLTNLAFGTRYTATLKSTLLADNGLTLFPAQDYIWSFTTHQPVPNLSTSTKTNAINGVVRSGDWVTYTISLINTGDLNATVRITDVLRSYYAVANALDFTQPTTGTLTWTGMVTASQTVNVQFVARVKPVAQLPIGLDQLLSNSATVNDGLHPAFTLADQTPPIITIYGVYLPLIRR